MVSKIRLDNISVSFPVAGRSVSSDLDEIVAIRELSLKLDSGDRIGVVGRNGSGKSTLLKVVSGNIVPQYGNVHVEGQKLALINRGVGLISKATLRENATIKGLSFGLRGSLLKEYVTNVLELSRLTSRSGSKLQSLSTGMKGRFSIALNSQVVKPITIFDEWVGTLNVSGDASNNLLKRVIDEAEIVLLASHNDQLVKQLCNRVILLEQGEILYEGQDFDRAFDYLRQIKHINASDRYSAQRIFRFFKRQRSNDNFKQQLANQVSHDLLEQATPDTSPSDSQDPPQLPPLHVLNLVGESTDSLEEKIAAIETPYYRVIFQPTTKRLSDLPKGEKVCLLYNAPDRYFVEKFKLSRNHLLTNAAFPCDAFEKQILIDHEDLDSFLISLLNADSDKALLVARALRETALFRCGLHWVSGGIAAFQKRQSDLILIEEGSVLGNAGRKLVSLLETGSLDGVLEAADATNQASYLPLNPQTEHILKTVFVNDWSVYWAIQKTLTSH